MSDGTELHQPANERQPPALDREILVLGGVVVVGMILAILDATVVNVAIPTLGRDLHTSVATIQWVMTGYLLAFASAIPVTDWASRRLGAKRVWIGALLLFMAGSVLAGSAWSVESLIAFRVLQGAAAGLLMPVGQTILAQAAGPERMGRVMSVIGIPMLLAPIFGPVVGGAIVGAATWRWIFFVNLPVGLLAVLLAWRRLPAAPPPTGRPLDLRGLALLSPGLAVLVYGLSEAGTGGGFGSTTVLGGIAVGIALVLLFTRHALRRGSDALLDVSLFARRGFAAAAATNLLVGTALFGSLILLPLYSQLVRGERPLVTGLLLVPQGLGAALAMPFAGRLTDTLGARVVIPGGILVALAGTISYTQVDADTSYVLLAGALFLIGVGLGSTIVPSMAVAYGAVPRESMAHATSSINAIQRVAGSLGTALLAVVLQRSIEANLPRLDGGIGALAEQSDAARAQTAPLLAAAFATTFWVAAALVAATLVPALLLPRRPARGGADAEARGGGDAAARGPQPSA